MKECFICRKNAEMLKCYTCNFELCVECQVKYQNEQNQKYIHKLVDNTISYEEYRDLHLNSRCMVCKKIFTKPRRLGLYHYCMYL